MNFTYIKINPNKRCKVKRTLKEKPDVNKFLVFPQSVSLILKSTIHDYTILSKISYLVGIIKGSSLAVCSPRRDPRIVKIFIKATAVTRVKKKRTRDGVSKFKADILNFESFGKGYLVHI